MATLFEQIKSWDKLFLGMKLTEEEYKAIPYPEAELHWHVATKTVEAGAFIGQALVAPIYLLMRRKNPNALNVAKRFGPRGMAVGLLMGPVMTMGRANSVKMDKDGYFDRSFRLRHNVNQVNVDRWAYLGGIVGLIVGRGFGMATGVNAGWIGAALYNNFVRPKPPSKEAAKEGKK